VGGAGGCGGFGGAASADFICQVGLYCDLTQSPPTCASPDLSDEGASCTAGSCTGNTICVNTSTNCKLGPFKCFPTVSVANSKVANAYYSYLSCLASSKCPAGSVPFQGASAQNCAQKNCISQYKSYINSLGSSAVALAPAVAVLLVALFSSLLNIF
jgi:hypothetical protein